VGEARVERLLTLLGFEIVREPAGPDYGIDLVARQRMPLGDEIVYAVQYFSGTARADSRFLDRIDRFRSIVGDSQPLVIADDVRDDARETARRAGVALRTVPELVEQLVDLRACAAAVRRMFEDSELSRIYVALRAVTTGGETVNALDHAMSWVTGDGPRLLLVRGDPGSGKTSFLRRLAYELASRADQDLALPIPLLIELGHAATGATLESLLQRHLRAVIGWHGNPEAILYLLHAGRLILLLDGFDEMAVSSSDGAEEQLRILTRSTETPGSIASGNRMIVSCNPVGLRLDADAIDLVPFDTEQIARFLTNRVGPERAVVTLSTLYRAITLTPVALLPMVLELLVQVLELLMQDDVGPSYPGISISMAGLLERYVEHWIARYPNNAIRPAKRARLVERLAAELWKLATDELPREQFVKTVQATEPQLAKLPPEQIDLVLRSAPFLTRSEDGAYGFSHRSILAYVLVRHLLRCAELGVEALRSALTTERLDATCTSLFVELANRHTVGRRVVLDITNGPYTADATENAIRLAAAFDARSARSG